MTKLGGAGDRFGDCLCVHCAHLPWVSGRKSTQKSPDLTLKFRSLHMIARKEHTYYRVDGVDVAQETERN